MVLIKSTFTTASILLLFLSAALLSTARLHPAGGDEVNGISSKKASVATETPINNNKEKNIAAMDMKKQSVNSPKSSFHEKRSLSYDEFVAFTADYHPPRHHPPKNNK